MRRAFTVAVCLLSLPASLGLSACGGGDRPYDKVPASLPKIVPPADAGDLTAPSAASGASSAATTTTTTTDSTASTPTTPSSNSGAVTPAPTPTPATPNGGGAAPDTTTTPPQTTTANPGGATPDQNAGAGAFSKFCQDNPGAC